MVFVRQLHLPQRILYLCKITDSLSDDRELSSERSFFRAPAQRTARRLLSPGTGSGTGRPRGPDTATRRHGNTATRQHGGRYCPAPHRCYVPSAPCYARPRLPHDTAAGYSQQHSKGRPPETEDREQHPRSLRTEEELGARTKRFRPGQKKQFRNPVGSWNCYKIA